MMHLSEIWIYPVKSLSGIQLHEAFVREEGLQHDRHWMVVDEAGKFLTQRMYPAMALVDTEISESELLLYYRQDEADGVRIAIDNPDGDELPVQVWKDTVTAKTVSKEADKWLSEKLGKNVRLVAMQSEHPRRMSPEDSATASRLSFADDFPYLLTTETSLADLNSRLGELVNMSRFRPNIVIAGSGPFEENNWSRIKIGNIYFDLVKPCERCVMINVNQSTGQRGSEPLKTLAGYRKENRKIFFGQNMIARNYGIIKQGDQVEICG
jgi:uncharacterized protein YcbX